MSMRSSLAAVLICGMLVGLVACSTGQESLRLPDTAKAVGPARMLIPLTATKVNAAAVSQYWQLRPLGAGHWTVVILDRGRVISPFSVDRVGLRTSEGTRYAVRGSVTLSGHRYRAEYLMLNTDNFSGYIMLQREE